MKIEDIAKLLNDKHPDSVEHGEDSLFIKVATNKWQDVALSIKDNNKLKFDETSMKFGNPSKFKIKQSFCC